MSSRRLALGVALLSLFSLGGLLLATLDLGETLSPQGCRMSRMSPSYILQNKFDSTWTPHASRYTLWLYREVGFDFSDAGNGQPVLFIPGNAGSSQQGRSIASSATRQYYARPQIVSPAFAGRSAYKPLDFFAVDFNEDLSAFHGATLESQIEYSSKAVAYILSLYPPNTQIVVMGHSMGGVVATSLLPSTNISSIITMSTPHTLPPARFDNTIDHIYSNLRRLLKEDPTPIVSICGGATDMMIPSESCILPRDYEAGRFRRTVFSSALEGAWTGVGHREMVWCHQVRWRVARAALESAPQQAAETRVAALDRWLRDGHTLPPNIMEPPALAQQDSAHETVLPVGRKMVVKAPKGAETYLLPVPPATKFTLLLSRGTIDSVGPANPLPLRASVYQCKGANSQSSCRSIRPATLKLIPTPLPGKPFPVPHEGSDESEGVLLFEVGLGSFEPGMTHVAVKFEGGDGRGWIIAGFGEEGDEVTNTVSTMSLLFGGKADVPLESQEALHVVVRFPKLLSNVLLVYRAKALQNEGSSCKDALFPPLLAQTSNPDETHYFPLTDHNDRRVLLHTHLPGPFIDGRGSIAPGVTLDLYTSGLSDCANLVHGISITLDWPATLGRWATRYWTSTIVWSIGVVSLVIFSSWASNGSISPVSSSLNRYGNLLTRRLLPAGFIVSFLPLPKSLYLGNRGEPLFAVIAPVILVISSGIVIWIWWILSALICVLENLDALFSRRSRRTDSNSVTRNTLISICLLFLAIFLLIPWQVAYLGCWVLQLWNCAAAPPERPDDGAAAVDGASLNGKIEASSKTRANNANLNRHILLLMTCLLPLVAPILAVWVRTLITAGLTTPFNGDHNFIMVAPFLVLVDYASWTRSDIFARASFEAVLPARWLFVICAGVAIVVGSVQPYLVFHAVAITLGILVCTKIGRRYWDGSPSKTVASP